MTFSHSKQLSSSNKTRIGIKGFDQIGRQLYKLASQSDDIEVVAISDIGKPDILHYLLCSEGSQDCELEGNYLVNSRFRTRMLQNDVPGETPWDVFGIDVVIDGQCHPMEVELGEEGNRTFT